MFLDDDACEVIFGVEEQIGNRKSLSQKIGNHSANLNCLSGFSIYEISDIRFGKVTTYKNYKIE